jgi:DNA-binding response OmpR family regulator
MNQSKSRTPSFHLAIQDGQKAVSFFDESAGRDHVLIVDDDAQLCQMFLDYFTRCGYEASAAKDAAEALAAAQENSADIVILDIMLGDDNGLEVLSKLKQAHPGLPVVIVTGLGYKDEVLTEALEKGADGYMSKGGSPEGVLDQIKRLLAERRGPN